MFRDPIRASARRPLGRAAALLLALAALPGAAHACSRVPWFAGTYALPGTIAFVGHASPDTLLAGPGTMRTSTQPGHFGPPGTRTIFGQAVRVERLVPSAPAELRAAVAAAGGRVVLVPWDYGPDCSPVVWSRSARWLPDTASGLFRAVLRDSVHWVDGVPTLDVHAPQFFPYPTAVARTDWQARGLSPDSMLTPHELLELHEHLPTREAVEQRLDSALAPLRAWARAHPVLATRYPARQLVAFLEGNVAHVLFLRREVPLAGTYRVVVTLPDGDSTVFFARTQEGPSGPLPRIRRSELRARRAGDAPEAMYVLVALAESEAELPRGARRPDDLDREGYFAIADSVERGADGTTRQRGSLDVLGRSGLRAMRDPAAHRVVSTAAAAVDRKSRAEDSFAPGWFTIHPDGRVTYELLADPIDAPPGSLPVRVRAERVSLETMGRRAAAGSVAPGPELHGTRTYVGDERG